MGHYNNNFSALLYVVLVVVVSNQQNENREESVRRNRIFSHRRPRPQLEVEFSGLFLLQSSMEAVTEVYHYAVVSSYSTLTILKLLSQHMRTERASWYWKLWIMRCKKMWSDLILYLWPKKSVNEITKFIQTVRFIKIKYASISKYLCSKNYLFYFILQNSLSLEYLKVT